MNKNNIAAMVILTGNIDNSLFYEALPKSQTAQQRKISLPSINIVDSIIERSANLKDSRNVFNF